MSTEAYTSHHIESDQDLSTYGLAWRLQRRYFGNVSIPVKLTHVNKHDERFITVGTLDHGIRQGDWMYEVVPDSNTLDGYTLDRRYTRFTVRINRNFSHHKQEFNAARFEQTVKEIQAVLGSAKATPKRK